MKQSQITRISDKLFHTTTPVLNHIILLRSSTKMFGKLKWNCVFLRHSPYPYYWS